MIKKLLFTLTFLSCLYVNGQNLNWSTDVNAAIEISNKENKPLLLLFADKNASNTLLHSQILNTLDFALWSRDNVVLVKLDLTDDANNEFLDRNLNLKRAFAVDVVPSVCIAKATSRKGKINYQLMGKMGYKSGNVKNWISNISLMMSEQSQ